MAHSDKPYYRMMNLFLIGYRCTGKTTLGKLLAAKLGLKFVDADCLLKKETGLEIATFVTKRGWNAFRKKEMEVIDRLSQSNGQVIATGGGVVTISDNVTTMRSNGLVIWLQASVETIRQRMLADNATGKSRPSLTVQGALEEIEQVTKERAPLYEAAAHWNILTDNLNVDEAVNAISNLIAKH
jgi:shikimate kinase